MRKTTLLAMAATTAAIGAAPAPAAKTHHCKDVVLMNGGNEYNRARGVQAYQTTCKEARKVARGWMSGSDSADGPRTYGYSCVPWPDGGGVDCRKGKKYVSWGNH